MRQAIIYSKPNIAAGINNLIVRKTFYSYVKRICDIIMASVVLLVTAPVMLLLMILIKLESRGPAFYIQKRVGLHGNVFNVYKLRTMYIDNEDKGGGHITVQNDPRITRIGKLIRGCSLDEFPQFLNILKGEMSYIGPRPISLDEHNFVLNHLKSSNKPIPQGLIHQVKPGIAGWATLHGREKISYEDRFRYNAEYENNFSFMFDLKVSYLTFKKYILTYLFVIGLLAGFIGLLFL